MSSLDFHRADFASSSVDYEFVGCFIPGGFNVRFEAHPRVSARVQHERSEFRGGVDMVVVGKIREGQEFIPVVLSLVHEDPDVLFQFLVETFRLSVRLGVVGCRRGGSNAQEFVQLLGEFRHKLRTSIGDNVCGESVEFPHVPEEEFCSSACCDGGMGWNKVGSFANGVYNTHDGIVPVGLREFHDEVHGDCLPVFFWNFKWS